MAETLAEALTDAYTNNETIAAERYNLRATDEQVPQALSGWRPTLVLDGAFERSQQYFTFVQPGVQMLTVRNAMLTLRQPIYRGGSTVADVHRAEATVAAGQQQLSAIEQDQLLSTAIAYLDVFRDQGVVSLNDSLVDVLNVNRQNVDATFRAGTVTETDTSQAAARLSGAVASRLAAQSQLADSIARFRALVGRTPDKLAEPAVLGQVPATEDEAATVAVAHNPRVQALRQQLQAAREQVDVVFGHLLPKVDGLASVQHEDGLFAKGNRLNQWIVGVEATVPLYEGGNTYSQVREAHERVAQLEHQVADAERQVREQVTSAWSALQSARAQQQTIGDQIRANEIALRDTDKEVNVGTRTRLDLLNAQQELFSSRVNLVAAAHNTFAATFVLQASTGTFTPEGLGLAVKSYDPTKHLEEVRGKWIGTEPPAP